MDSIQEHSKFRRIGHGFCGSVWAAEGGSIAMKREDGGQGRSLLNDYNMHQLVLEATPKAQASVCVPRWPKFVQHDDDIWWTTNLSRFPSSYTPCNVLCSERIPPLPEEVRNRLIDEDCLVRLYLGRRKIQNKSRLNVFSLRNYPLHLNQAEDLELPILKYAHAMAEMLATMHWGAQIDANDIELVLGGVQEETEVADHDEYVHDFLGSHSLWILDFDCCKPLTMDDAGVEQAANAFLNNDPYFPRPPVDTGCHPSTLWRDSILWIEFRNRYLEWSRRLLVPSDGVGVGHTLPDKFIARVVEMHEENKERTASVGKF